MLPTTTTLLEQMQFLSIRRLGLSIRKHDVDIDTSKTLKLNTNSNPVPNPISKIETLTLKVLTQNQKSYLTQKRLPHIPTKSKTLNLYCTAS